MREGDLLELDVQRNTFAGPAEASANGAELQVAGAFAGESVEARLLQLNRRRTLGRARVVRVIRPHAERREAACAHHPERGGRCDGCAFMSVSLSAQREAKRALLADLGLTVTGLEGDEAEWGYRHSVKRVVLGEPGSLYLGSYQRASHRGARMDHCLVDHPLLQSACAWLTEVLQARRIQPYDSRRSFGDLRYVWLRTDATRVLVTLVTAAEDSAAVRELKALEGEVPDYIGLSHSVQSEDGNAMRGESARALLGPQVLQLRVLGQAVEVGPLGFLQPNPSVAALCYQALMPAEDAVLPAGARAVDLYAGSGVTTRLLRERFQEVIANEALPESAAALGVEPEPAEACVNRLLRAQTSVELLVANPPRAGLREAVCEGIRALAPARVHIMSCGPAALARDIGLLTAGGAYVLHSLRAFDTLPQTPHVELVAQLVRASGQEPVVTVPDGNQG